ncbi:TonB-dependent receptor [Phenylobacterium sp.]|uniref:TonB-dependent receptor n=1 Tax=Phenylobacterium sp. TaxID=1871053 RepID=UPI002F3F4007
MLGSAGASLLATLLAGTPCRAADADRPSTDVTEVVVTAEKRAEAIMEVPAAVTAVTAAQLQTEKANGLEDYVHDIPSLSLTPGSQGTNQLAIRGVNSSVFTGPTVGIYLDETPIGGTVAGDHANGLVPDLDPNDLERVEVLRGPQGTLYGAANMGGLLKFVTAAPSLTTASGRLQVDGTSVDHGDLGYVVRGSFTGPLVQDKLGIRISAFSRRDPGFIDDPGVIANSATNQKLSDPARKDINSARVEGGRAALLWQVSPDAKVELSALYQDRHGDGQTAEDVDGRTLQPLHGDLTQIASRFTGQNAEKLQVYNATANWDLHGATLLSSTSYAINNYSSVTDITGLTPPSPTAGFPPASPPFFVNAGAAYFTFPAAPTSYFTPVDLAFRTAKVTQELRLTSPSDQRVEWQLGLFYTREQTTSLQEIDLDDPATGATFAPTGVCAPPVVVGAPFPPITCFAIHSVAPAGTPFHNSGADTTYREYAGYGDVTFHVTDAFSLQAGLRHAEFREVFHEHYSGVLDSLSTGAFSGVNDPAPNSGSKNLYLLGAKYQVDKNVMVYGRIATGYRPGGPNLDAAGVSPTFASDSTTNYEVGVKGVFADGRLQLTADTFTIHWDDIQLQTTTPMSFFYFVNGSTARSQGFEVEALLQPVTGLTLRANGAYTEAQLTADIPAAASVFGFKGDALPYSPKWTANLSADYAFPVAGGWEGHAGADYQFVGSVFDNFYPCNTGSGCATAASRPPPREQLPSYEVVNFRLAFARDAWNLGVYLKNAFDGRGLTALSVQHATFGLAATNGKLIRDSATMITPRTIGVSVVRTF